MRAREGAEEAGVLVGAVVDFDDIVERRLEEGELPKDHWEERERGRGRHRERLRCRPRTGRAQSPGVSAAFISGAWQR